MTKPTDPLGSSGVSQASSLRTLRDLPGPRGLPLVGNALDIKPRELHRLVRGWAETYGPLYVFRVATQPILTVADADIIQQLLRDRPERFRRWRKIAGIAADIGADGLFTAEGERWRRQRKFVMHALNASHVREFIPRFETVAARLRRRWWKAALRATPVDVLSDLMRLTVDVTSGLAFGKDINTLEEIREPIQVHLDKLFPAIARRQTALFPYWRYIELPRDRELTAAVREIGRFISELITQTSECLAANPELREKPANLAEALVAAQEKDDDGPTDGEIAANIMTLLLAGEDTTANTLAYMIHFLTQYPEIQKSVQEEVDEVFGVSDQPWQDPATPDRLRYIEAFANEAMRCKPVGGHLFLEPNEDVQIRDVLVPKGTPVLVLNGYVGLQEANFSRAGEFRPERWLEGANAQMSAHNTRAFMPFGAGPRFCPGRQLAMLQIKMVTAMLCRDFDVIRPEDAEPVDDIYNFTVGPTHFNAIMRPRRPVRPGVDIDFRQREQRTVSIAIHFPDRRMRERRKAPAGADQPEDAADRSRV